MDFDVINELLLNRCKKWRKYMYKKITRQMHRNIESICLKIVSGAFGLINFHLKPWAHSLII